MSALGAAIGLLAAAGLIVVLVRLPALRGPRLDDRMAPHLRDTARPSALLGTARTASGPVRWIAPLVVDLAGRVDRLLGGSASVRRRLDALGSSLSVEQFRQEQVLWGGLGALAGMALLVVRLAAGLGLPAVSLVGLVMVGAVGGVFGRDAALSRGVHRREEQISLELPTIAELLALAVSAGESPVAALERVTRGTGGELTAELRLALADARSGMPFAQALSGIANRTSLPSLARFVDGVAVALQRGTPLAEVLRAQAVDVRDAGRREMLEAGGRREIAMMLPVVFLVLPVTILFALYPGAVTLTSIAS